MMQLITHRPLIKFTNILFAYTLGLWLLSAFVSPLTHANQPSDGEHHINVLVYHNVAEDTPFSTTVTPAVFTEHMDYLDTQGFHVMALDEAMNALQAGQPVPKKAIAITFDDAWRNIYTNALPILEQYHYPFTIFVNTDPIDKGTPSAMTWDMLRDIKKRGALLANHTVDHDYLVRYHHYDQAWLSQVMNNIHAAQQRLEAETGPTPKFLAYPYGEYNNMLKQAVKQAGYIAFGQQSGGIAKFSDWQALPRFPVAGRYGKVNNSFKLKLASRPLPVNYAALPETLVRLDKGDANPPVLKATILSTLKRSSKDQLNCFILGDATQPKWHSKLNWQVVASKPLPKGRQRYNCTAPVFDANNKRRGYYWFSQQWLMYDSPSATERRLPQY